MNSDKNYCIGIDLGTTNTVASYWIEGDQAPEILDILQPVVGSLNFDSHNFLPSAILVEEDNIFVGKGVKEQGRLGRPIITSNKRRMGSFWRKNLHGETWTPEKLSGVILKVIKKELNKKFDGEPEKVVITVPASFGTDARRATLKAARLAGFDVERTVLLDEPTASLLPEIYLHADDPSELAGNHIVVDIGGGTLDVAVLNVNVDASRIDVVGMSRYNELAGDDFDLNIAGFILSEYEKEMGKPIEDFYDGQESEKRKKLFFSELLYLSEKHKISLSKKSAEEVLKWKRSKITEELVFRYAPTGEWKYKLGIQAICEAIQELFEFHDDNKVRLNEVSFFKPIEEALASARKVVEFDLLHDLKSVWLTGGSSLIPVVADAVHHICKAKPKMITRPLDAVSIGATLFAGISQGYRENRGLNIQQRLHEGIFLQLENGKILPIFSAQTLVPCEESFNGLKMPATHSQLEVELFSATAKDEERMPFATRRVSFDEIIPEGNIINFNISIDENRNANLDFMTSIENKSLTGFLKVSSSLGWEMESEIYDLPEVNLK